MSERRTSNPVKTRDSAAARADQTAFAIAHSVGIDGILNPAMIAPTPRDPVPTETPSGKANPGEAEHSEKSSANESREGGKGSCLENLGKAAEAVVAKVFKKPEDGEDNVFGDSPNT